jgi:ribosomal-protein-alanine N-acetyltransferase
MSKKPIIELHGNKVSLRRPQPADFREFSALTKASRARYRGLVRNQASRKEFTDFIRRSRRDDACGFLICRRADGAIVGSMGLFNIVRLHVRTAFIGYAIGTPHARQGYATEALQLVLRFAFRKLRLHRVEASIQPHNAPSIALVKRAGFACEGLSRRLVKIGGRWRDHERWAILAEDWRPLRRN